MTLGFIVLAIVEFLYILDASAWPGNAIIFLQLALNCPISYC
jgi:hypothetical protein